MGTTNKKRESLHSSFGRPSKGALSIYSSELRGQISVIRRANPGFGAASILANLIHEFGHTKTELPNRSRIAAFLKEQALTQTYEKHSSLPKPAIVAPKNAHNLWQLDGRGNEQVIGVGAVALLNIMDVFSNTYISCFPALMKSMQGHPNTVQYQTVLRLGFLEFGLPKRIQTDHASVFHENNSKSPFPTKFHLWLIGLGIKLFHSRVHRPTDQAKVERSNQILYNQILKGNFKFQNWKELFEKCQKRRNALNYHIDSSACQYQPPLELNPKARHSERFYAPQREHEMIQMSRVYEYLAKGKWFRKATSNRTVSLGGQIYYVKNAKPKEQFEVSFCPKCQYLLFRNDNEHLVALLPIKGLNKQTLMGSCFDSFNIPNLQLPIPFNWEEIIDTTFRDFGVA